MQPFTRLDAKAVPLDIANIDTDQIIPKQFLKVIDREGLAKGLFYDLRFDQDGKEKPGFVLNQAAYEGAGVLIAGDNFGCGSSREHAAWALMDFGLKVVIAPSFADIFHGNALNNGLLPVALPEAVVAELMEEAKGGNHVFTVDLESQTVTSPSGKAHRFEIDPNVKEKLLKGLDAIGETLQRGLDIDVYEQRRALDQPWLEKTPGVIVILGTVRLPAENLGRARPAMAAMVEGSRAEDGCLDYAYAEDVLTPGLIRVMEVWRDQASLDAHRTTAHMTAWRAAWPDLGLGGRDLVQYVAGPPERI